MGVDSVPSKFVLSKKLEMAVPVKYGVDGIKRGGGHDASTRTQVMISTAGGIEAHRDVQHVTSTSDT